MQRRSIVSLWRRQLLFSLYRTINNLDPARSVQAKLNKPCNIGLSVSNQYHYLIRWVENTVDQHNTTRVVNRPIWNYLPSDSVDFS